MTSPLGTREDTLEYLARFQAIIRRTGDINDEGNRLLTAARQPATSSKPLPYALHALLGIGAVAVLVNILNSVTTLMMLGEKPFIHYLLFYPIILGIYAYGSWKHDSTGSINGLHISPARFTVYLFAIILPMLLRSNDFHDIAIYQLAFVLGLLVSACVSLKRTFHNSATPGNSDTFSEHIHGAAAASGVYALMCIGLVGSSTTYRSDMIPEILLALGSVLIGCLVGTFTYLRSASRRAAQENTQTAQREQAVERMTALQHELRELNQEYIAEGMDQFPREYTDPEIIGALHSMIASGAVESVPEAMERYDSESYLRSWEVTRRELTEGSIARDSEKERLNHALTLHRVLTEIDIIPESK